MNRREFIALLGGTVASWPLSAGAQQQAIPVIGFVGTGKLSPGGPNMTAFHQGLNEGGYVEGRNVAIEYRWAGGQYDRLPALLADVIRRQASVIVASGGLVSALEAKAATDTIPTLFIAGFDPVQVGLVTSINRPGGNATGVSVYTTELGQKRLEWLHRMLPQAVTIGLLVNPISTRGAVPKIEIASLQSAARSLGLRLLVLEASTDSEIDAAFASAARQQADALMVNADPFFTPRSAQIVALASHYALPTLYPWREYVEAGGLISYGPVLTWAYRRLGLYASRILRGEKPSELPVEAPTRIELIVNLKTAETLGLRVPRLVLQGANETIQ
jgi:putative tryptophan/tyrosine transport system substrate-binding protein